MSETETVEHEEVGPCKRYVNLPESQEPLLMESRPRFVLFPIQYHEGTFLLSTRQLQTYGCRKSGKCTRKLKPPSERQRRWTLPRTFMIGTTV
ncbi:hypothetical protein BC827DRAFT_1218000 [Russula dissimulans]|nr:hypothetical protein BC827DRAFT_1218000 [Russula dissimulans]